MAVVDRRVDGEEQRGVGAAARDGVPTASPPRWRASSQAASDIDTTPRSTTDASSGITSTTV